MDTIPIMLDGTSRNGTKTELNLTEEERSMLCRVLSAVLEGFVNKGNTDCLEYYRIRSLGEKVNKQQLTQQTNRWN